MGRTLTGWLLLLSAAVAVLLPATARADLVYQSNALTANRAHVGVINLGYSAPYGSRVEFSERIGDRVKPLGAATASRTTFAGVQAAVRWRCDRVVRRFEAQAVAPDGARSHDSYDVRTPSCANRFRLSAPHRVAPGATARVRVKDVWKNGDIKPRLCITPPRGMRACRVLAFPRAVDIAGRRFRATKRGVWRLELQVDGHRVRGAVAVGRARAVSPKPRPTVLATGDSTMGGLDSLLGDRLAGTAKVPSKVYNGSGVSRALEWVTRAVAQAKRFRPRTTVISLGDLGYPMQTPAGATLKCCDALWAAEYRRRVRLMMKTYIRDGRGHILWLTIPTPRAPENAAIISVTNAAILRAAKGLAGARVLRLDLLFTPNGYQEYITHRGRAVRVRQNDGLHLTVAGNAIAAEAVEKILRTTPGWLGRGS